MMIDTEPAIGPHGQGAARKLALAIALADIDAVVGSAVGKVAITLRFTEAERLAELIRAVHA